MKKIKLIVLVLTVMLTAVFLAGCGSDKSAEKKEAAKEDKRIKVVATIFPEYDFLRQIGGEKINLSMLVPPGAETHSFEPTPKDIKKANAADLFVYVGGDSDEWVDRILKSVDNKKQSVAKLMDMVKTVEEKEIKGMTPESREDEDRDDHKSETKKAKDDKSEKKSDAKSGAAGDKDGKEEKEEKELDEHVWTAPENAIKIVRKLSEKLGRIDPDNKGYYEKNADAYIAKLKKLDANFKKVVKNGKRREIIVGDRFPFRYFADEYKLKYYAAFPGCSTDTEASAETIAFLTKKVKKDKIPVVFHIELSNAKVCTSICEATGAKKRQLNAIHNVTKEDFKSGAGYLSLMEQNLKTLKEALN